MSISVIIPARNAVSTLDACLRALASSTAPDFELIVVDDASDDETGTVAHRHGARVVRLDAVAGPAAARNAGALLAAGRILVFIDADVAVAPTTLERLTSHFTEGGPAAVFGSYDADPPHRDFSSLYKNLFHHFTHQTADRRARTFWAGCGAVERRAFLAAGGFNERYRVPSVEDIELGYRLDEAGHRILLDRSIQVTHLKRWTLRRIVATDIARRAVPWGRLLLRRGRLRNDLNLRWSHRASVVLAYGATSIAGVLTIPTTTVEGTARGNLWGALLATLATLIALNLPLYRFFATRVSWRFALWTVPVHCLYYLYSGAALLWAGLTLRWAPPAAGSLPGHGDHGATSPS